MGINNLLVYLRSIEQKKHITDYHGQTIAVDGYCWIHKAIYTSGYEIAVQNDYSKLIKFMLQRCAYILAANIKLVMVYDGDKLPCKEKTENKRSENREVQKNKAFEFLTNGEHDKANRKFAESIDVTPLMAWRILKGIRQTYPQVECIVAPYEADAQLAYLSKIGYVDAVITEDSDLIPFGAACIIYKMDHNYECKQI